MVEFYKICNFPFLRNVRYQQELPKKLNHRKETFLSLEELCLLMKWKLTVS